MRNSIIPVFIPHLGCPHDCVFCNQKRISGSLSPVRPEEVAKAVEAGLEKCGRAELAFYGGSFTAVPMEEQAALLDAAGGFVKSGRITSIRVSTRPDAIDGEILDLLWEKGVRTIELGSQSMIDSVLAASGRGHTAEDTVRASEMIKGAGFSLVLQMMTGLPGSGPEQDLESAQRIAALAPDAVRIYPTVIVRDTALADMWRAGLYAEHTVEDAAAVCAEIVPVFEKAGIDIIRLGLNPTEDLSGGDALAGAYHPALGEIVRSRIYLNKVREKLMNTPPGSNVIVGVHPSHISQMTGQKRRNVETLMSEFGLRSLKIRGCSVEKGDIIVDLVANTGIM